MRFKIVGNYLLFFIGSFGISSVFWRHAQNQKNAPFPAFLETLSKMKVVYLCKKPTFRPCHKIFEKKMGFSPP